MSLSMLSMLSTGNSFAGASQVFGVRSSGRYRYLHAAQMRSYGLYQNLSSGIVYGSPSVDATVLLFRPIAGLIDLGSFNGDFMQMTVRRGDESPLQIDRFAHHHFDNRARSMMLVAANRGPELRFSFRDLILNRWRRLLDQEIAGTQVQRRGDPSLTWKMWPVGINHLSPDRMYLELHQRLNIDIEWWPDYDASVTYHLYLYLDPDGRLRGHTARWAYWVESGVKSGTIGDRLEPAVKRGMSRLDAALSAQLDTLPDVRLSDLYYLPGRQLNRAPTGVLTGNSLSDVTIVAQM